MTLDSAEWFVAQAESLIEEYKNAKTLRQRKELFPKLKTMLDKLDFEKRTIDKIIL